MPVEPISLSLAVLALLDPAVKSVRKAYGVYKLSQNFGEHYVGEQRRLDAEKARLETSLELQLGQVPDRRTIDTINAELGHMRRNFQGCQDLIAQIDKAKIPVDTKDKTGFFRRAFGIRRKTARKSVDDASVVASSLSSNPRARVASSDASSGSTITVTSQLALESEEVKAIEDSEISRAQHLQKEATISRKTKWVTEQRKAFSRHIDDLARSNDVIRDIVTTRALQGIYSVLVVSAPGGEVPTEVTTVGESLRRLNGALTAANKKIHTTKSMQVGLRFLKPVEYGQMRKRLAPKHPNIAFRQDTYLYPLQVHVLGECQTMSRLLLAESLRIVNPVSDHTIQGVINPDTTLMQMLEKIDADADEALRPIGSVVATANAADIHNLIQDISTTWSLRTTLSTLIRTSPKHRTFLALAVQIAISYVYITATGLAQSYPRLEDYRYYDPHTASDQQQQQQPQKPKALTPESILLPYLYTGFGSPPSKASTVDIGGSTGNSLDRNEALCCLGLLLHQIGCWKLLPSAEDKESLGAAIETATRQHNDLVVAAGMPFAQVVQLCLESREDGDSDDAERAKGLYSQVVLPLQALVDELKWR